jgi:hypothetical protein
MLRAHHPPSNVGRCKRTVNDQSSGLPIKDLTSEADVELRLVEPLLRALGYEDDDIAAKYPVQFREGRVGRWPEADYVCFAGPLKNRDTSLLVVEAKGPDEALPPGKVQGESYAANLRAPVLVLTNGKTFEIWQLQAAQESVCVLDIPVASLSAERGRIEQLLGKAALIAYCRSFAFKTILEGSADYGAYETAELKRTGGQRASLERTLKRAGANGREDRIEASRLTEGFPGGATIVAASGYGKTTLAARLFREAIEARWRKNRTLLPFDVPLPDLVQLRLGIPEFLHARLSAHCPGVSLDALKQILRDISATLFCDGFDRVAAASRTALDAELSTFIRDYPKAQVFVFSRPASKPGVALPVLELEALTDDQMRAIERAILDEDNKNYSVIGLMPEMLRTLCKNPLLLGRALAFWKLNRTFPTRIRDLFQSWLSSMLKADPNDAVSTIEREHGLTVIAQATLITPLVGERALALFKESGIRSEVLNDLINCDAVRVTGSVVEVQHEAMADYLRAMDVAAAQENLTVERLAALPVAEDSFFPVLLMALLPTNRLQSAWWRRLSAASIRVYGDALRYRFDVSAELKKLEPEKLSHDYLTKLLDGIEMPLNGVFPDLRRTVVEHLIGDADGAFAVTGMMDHSNISYMLHTRGSPDAPRVKVAVPKGPGTYRYVNLNLSNIRLNSGRLLGAKLLSETILEMVRHQRLNGGPVWAAERLIGRVRYLIKTYTLPVALDAPLDSVEAILKPQRDRWVYSGSFGGGESFSVQWLLDDIEALRATSVTALDPWWLRLGWDETASSQSDDIIARVLNEHYRRVQLAYVEIVDKTFSGLAKQMGFYSALPLRWDLTVVRREPPSKGATVYYKILPTTSWDQAGADVRFSDHGPGFADFEEFQNALAKLGRSTSIFYGRSGFTPLPNFDGRQWAGHFDGATTVVHEVCSMLKDELEGLFSAIPSYDGAN